MKKKVFRDLAMNCFDYESKHFCIIVRLWNKMKQDASGKAPFQELMKVLGLEPDTGDTCGLSALISMENDRFLAERKQDHEARSV